MNQLKAGVVLNYVAIGVNMVVGLLYTPYMLRMLGQSEYGLYSLAASIIAYLTVLDLGFAYAIVRYTAKFRAEGRQREQEEMFGMFFLLYMGIAVIAVACGSLLACNVEDLFSSKMTAEELDRTRIMLWLMTFNLAFTFPMSIWGAIMTAYERFVFQRVVSITRSVLNPLVMILLLTIGYKAVAMVVVTTVFNVVTLFINCWYCRNHLHIQVRFARFRWQFLREVSVYSFWIFLNVIMDRIYWSTGQFILGIYKGTVAIAVYSVAIQLQQMFMMFSTAISSVFLPKVTAMVAKGNDRKAISDLFIRTGRMQYIVIAYILTSFVLFGKPFIQMWAGPEYGESYVIALLFLVPLTVPLIQNLGITILQARNEMKFRSLLYIVISLASLGLSIALAKHYGGLGCAFATALALTASQIVVMNVYYQRKQSIDILRFWKEIGRMSLVPALFIVGGLLFLYKTSLELSSFGAFAVGGLVFTLLYVPAFWHFCMNAEERALLKSPFLRIRRRIVR